MSYCRWSSDDFDCDVYVYQSDRGWETHVAGRRHVFVRADLPIVDPDADRDTLVTAWLARHVEVSRRVDAATLVDIGLPHDGESFHDDTPGECADRLEGLRATGYHVPQGAIDALREDDADG